MLILLLFLASPPDIFEQACDVLARLHCAPPSCPATLERWSYERRLDVGCLLFARTAADVRACGLTECRGRP